MRVEPWLADTLRPCGTPKRENCHLPTLWEWLGIRTLTHRGRWTDRQRAMMQRASRFHRSRLTIAAVLLGLITAAGLWTWNRVDRNRARRARAESQRAGSNSASKGSWELVSAEPNQLPVIVKELDANPELAATYLSPLLAANARTVDEKRTQLHARLAQVSRDRALVEPLLEELLTNKVVYVGPIRQLLRHYAGELTEKLRAILRDEKAEAPRRFRAAVALVDYVPESDAASWSEHDLKFVTEQLVSSNAEFQLLTCRRACPIVRDCSVTWS